MTVLRKAATAALLLAAAAPAAPANAACFGSATTAKICVFPENVVFSPTGGAGIHECVTIVAPPCVPVNVPTPSAGTSGPLYSAECYACTDVPGVVDTVTDAAAPYLERADRIVDQATRMECAPARSSSDAYAAPPVLDNLRNFIYSCLN